MQSVCHMEGGHGRAPEVLGGQLAAEQDGRVLADGLLDNPGALGDARNDLERAVPPLVNLLRVALILQEPARQHQLALCRQSLVHINLYKLAQTVLPSEPRPF